MTYSANGEITVTDVVTEARSGGTPSRTNKEFYGGNIPWLKSGEVIGDGIADIEESVTQAGLDASAAWIVPAGSVLVAMYGETRGQVGRNAIPLSTNQAVISLVPDPLKCDPDFFYYWMRSRQKRLRSKGAGAAQKNLSKALVVSEPFPKIPVEEQRVVVGRLSSADASVSVMERELVALQRFSISLRRELFGGGS